MTVLASVVSVRTEYADGDIVATPKASALLFQDSGNVMRVPSPSHPFPVSTVSGGAVTLANEATYPKTVDVTTGGAGVTVLAANASRKPGSYIFNLSDTELEFNYDTTLTPGSSGLVGPGQVLKLYEGNYIYPGAVRMYQASGSTKKVWVASFI